MRIFFFAAACCILACESPTQSAESPALVVQFPTELRTQPDGKSTAVCPLPEGAELTDLRETSRFFAAVSIADSLLQEPWLRAKTADGRSGWVFGGAVAPSGLEPEAAERWLHKKRTQSLFGAELSGQIWAWADQHPPATDTAFAAHWRSALHLRDTMNQLLARAVSRDAASAPADLSWLRVPMRYFFIQPAPRPCLYPDYRLVARAATRTRGEHDDRFARIGLAAYPLDSVESVLPAWVFPLGLEESCSNFGAGQHLDMLRKIEAALTACDLFRPELLRWKDQILADILDNSRTYWQPKEKILAELDRIVAARLGCLSDRDRLALEARRGMFEAGGVRMDLRSGK